MDDYKKFTSKENIDTGKNGSTLSDVLEQYGIIDSRWLGSRKLSEQLNTNAFWVYSTSTDKNTENDT